MTPDVSRRTFLLNASRTGGVAVASSFVGPLALAQNSPSVPDVTSKKPIRVAFVGTGGICKTHIRKAVETGLICPCYCDVDTRRFWRAAEAYPGAKSFRDFREMYDKMGSEFDAVFIGTPDHTHYPATMLAMQMGKHVYTQKPLTHTVWEAQQLLKAADKYKVATQMGNQGHANEGNRRIVEYIRGGFLGDIKEIHAWTDRPIWPQGMDRPEPEEPHAVPNELDWDSWIGPAPMRPFVQEPPENNKLRGPYHPFRWRGWWDFGGGALADMACHTIDGVYWAMDPPAPTAIDVISVSRVTKEAFPNASVLKFEFPAKGTQKPFDLYWYDGGLFPPRPEELDPRRKLPPTGNLVIGSKAKMLVSGSYGDSPQLIPAKLHREVGKPPQLVERSIGHGEEWFAACRGEIPYDAPGSSFHYSARLTEVVLLGNLAIRAQKRIEWDADKQQVTNIPEANQWVTKEYRDGWYYEV